MGLKHIFNTKQFENRTSVAPTFLHHLRLCHIDLPIILKSRFWIVFLNISNLSVTRIFLIFPSKSLLFKRIQMEKYWITILHALQKDSNGVILNCHSSCSSKGFKLRYIESSFLLYSSDMRQLQMLQKVEYGGLPYFQLTYFQLSYF